MGRRLFDFRCSTGHVFEVLVECDVRLKYCEQCKTIAERLIGAPRPVLDGTSGDFPTAADQWERRRESHMKKERRNKERHGTYT